MRRTSLLTIAPLALVMACSPDTRPPQPAESPEPTETPTPAAAASAPAAPSPSSSPTAPKGLLPLDTGVYVLADTPCENSANAGFRRYDGHGLGGSATRACVSKVTSSERRTYTLDNDCEDTYSGDRSTARLTVTVADRTRFTLAEEGEPGLTYRLCPALNLSDFGG